VLCCAVLCCAVLCCAVLCCAVLCCAVLCCAVLCCAVLCCAVPPLQRVYYFWGLQQEETGVVLPDGRPLPPRWYIRDMLWQVGWSFV
jgi:hypothetical protein